MKHSTFRNITCTLALGFIALPGLDALAEAPAFLPVQGHIASSEGEALDGDVNVTFRLYPTLMGGTALYEETQPVTFRSGHFFAYLGDGGALDLSIFADHDAMYLGMTIGEDTEMRPRILLASTGYAAYANNAGNAKKLGGKDASEYALKSDTATLTWNGLQDIPAEFADGIDNDTTYTASTGLSLNGNSFRVNRSVIEAWTRNACYDTEAELRATLDQYYSAGGTGVVSWSSINGLPPTFADGLDDDTTYAAGNGIELNGNAFSVNQSTIEGWIQNLAYTDLAQLRTVLDSIYLNQTATVTWSNIAGLPPGFADFTDNDTTYAAGNGIDLNGNAFSVNQATVEGYARGVAYDTEAELTAVLDDNYMGAGYTPDWNMLSGVPQGFADGIDNDTTYAAGNGIDLNGNAFSVNQATIDAWIQSGAFTQVGELRASLDTVYLAQNATLAWANLSGLPVSFADGIDDDTTYAAGNGIDLNGNAFSVNQATVEGYARGVAYDTEAELTAVLDDNYVGAGYTPDWNMLSGIPQGFADGIDNDTTYAAGPGLDLSGNAFSLNTATVESTARNVAYDTVTELRAALDSVYLNQTTGSTVSTITGLPARLDQLQNLNCSEGDVIYVGSGGNLECRASSTLGSGTGGTGGTGGATNPLTAKTNWARGYTDFEGGGVEGALEELKIASDTSGNFYIIGQARDGSPDLGDGNLGHNGVSRYRTYVASYNSQGAHRWSILLQTSGNTSSRIKPLDIAIGQNNSLFITGWFNYTMDFGGGTFTSVNSSYDGFIASFNTADGSHRWSQSFGSTGTDLGTTITVAPNGSIYVAGSERIGSGNYQYFIRNYSSSGAITWTQAFSTNDTIDPLSYPFRNLATDSNNNLYFVGQLRAGTTFGGTTIANSSDSVIGSLDPSGNLRWSNTYDVRAWSVAIDQSDNVFVTGDFYGTTTFGGNLLSSVAPNYQDVFLVSFSATGDHRWSRSFGGPNTDYAYEVTTDQSGNIYIGGWGRFSTNLGSSDNRDLENYAGFIASYRGQDGQYNWDQIYDGPSVEYLSSLTYSNGRVYATGSYNSQNTSEACDFGGQWPLPIGPSTNAYYLFTLSMTP